MPKTITKPRFSVFRQFLELQKKMSEPGVINSKYSLQRILRQSAVAPLIFNPHLLNVKLRF
ncbi:hypothetical protein COO91_08057 [Nostoc flagelliforme CCNUN1]|uniref:Uncharacterized protein n=1 Tax=Nostoc flagelliforme CCNUN1 TaxID=2038116 RepID=A0A2K8T2N3_9NOSO|nr:hypothetical protein COO91_08057 [Nostoc flagelliforme CCNUN1]